MKVLILDQETQLYVAHQGQWTGNAQEAQDFGFTAHARSVAQGLALRSYQILFFFPDINYRIVVCDSGSVAEPVKA